MSVDGDGKKKVFDDFKHINQPLLDTSPKQSAGSPNPSDDNFNIPDSNVRPVADDTASGFTHGDYMRPQNFKSQT